MQKKEERSRKRALYDTLTPKEQEIAKLVAQDKLNKVIAFDLNITEHTVKLHRGNLYKKLGVRTVTELFFILKRNRRNRLCH
ncbi:response regulator transcription factor [Parasutterella excrementihominis]|uniref:response regulator transcription factor n=1 Tax=Parasutterella excrementihominis TaxID=487175 RepID=UPI003C6E74C0